MFVAFELRSMRSQAIFDYERIMCAPMNSIDWTRINIRQQYLAIGIWKIIHKDQNALNLNWLGEIDELERAIAIC